MDTIVAISTAQNQPGGVGIVRVSGDEALNIAKRIFDKKNKDWVPNYMYLGTINGDNFKEQAFCVYFKMPFSFTGEDVIEFHCHGGQGVLSAVSRLIQRQGARQAYAGEFSKRAFLNGKLDLAKAEGISELIKAENEAGIMQAYRLMSGELSQKVISAESFLLQAASNLEAVLDYPDELEEDLRKPTLNLLEDAKKILLPLYENSHKRRYLSEGIFIVLTGIPNAGKSSLLNALIQDDRAIVTEIAGTTRDTLSENIIINGIKFRFTDTAGIHNSHDRVEIIGIDKALKAISSADLVINIIDLSQKISEDEIALNKKLEQLNCITVGNKVDIQKYDRQVDIKISSKTGEGIEELTTMILERMGAYQLTDTITMTNERHISAVYTALESIISAIQNYDIISIDCTIVDIKKAYSALSSITGTTVSEAIVDKIFSSFCVGK